MSKIELYEYYHKSINKCIDFYTCSRLNFLHGFPVQGYIHGCTALEMGLKIYLYLEKLDNEAFNVEENGGRKYILPYQGNKYRSFISKIEGYNKSRSHGINNIFKDIKDISVRKEIEEVFKEITENSGYFQFKYAPNVTCIDISFNVDFDNFFGGTTKNTPEKIKLEDFFSYLEKSYDARYPGVSGFAYVSNAIYLIDAIFFVLYRNFKVDTQFIYGDKFVSHFVKPSYDQDRIKYEILTTGNLFIPKIISSHT